MSARERNKGARGELEVVEILRGHRPAVTRNFASGAAGNGDLANGPAGVLIECKRTERFQIRKAWAQASGDAAAAVSCQRLRRAGMVARGLRCSSCESWSTCSPIVRGVDDRAGWL